MAATILTPDHYDAVRALIAPDVTDAHISDDYLSQDPFAPDAEREVRERLSEAEIDVDALTGNDLKKARLAMMHECMTVLCLTVPQLLRQTELEVITEMQSIDWKEKKAFHQEKVHGLVSSVIKSVQAAAAPQQESRALPFGPVGTLRREKGQSAYPYSRTVDRS